jgi:hypothetical protein
VGFDSAIDLLATYAGQAADLQPWVRNAQINHDRDLRLMYLAGMGANLYQEGKIYDQILSHRKYPERLLTASDKSRLELMRRMNLDLGR